MQTRRLRSTIANSRFHLVGADEIAGASSRSPCRKAASTTTEWALHTAWMLIARPARLAETTWVKLAVSIVVELLTMVLFPKA